MKIRISTASCTFNVSQFFSIYLLFKTNIMKECDFPKQFFYRTDNNFIALHFAENNV
jgi:hypothetical protein